MKTDKLLTQREAAALLGVTVKTLQIWRRNRQLEAVRLGYHSIRIRESEVARLIRRRTVMPIISDPNTSTRTTTIKLEIEVTYEYDRDGERTGQQFRVEQLGVDGKRHYVSAQRSAEAIGSSIAELVDDAI